MSIHDRPKIVARRKQFGHWEVLERITPQDYTRNMNEYPLTRFERLNRITALEVVSAGKKIFETLPEQARRSTILDNG